ncbi:MAG: helix-turn-helix domain-containing protein [Thermoanaerobaculia bacterium]
MIIEASQNVLSQLEDSIRASKLSRREVERRLGMGQGYLNSLFKGRIQLRVAHVYEIARVLEVEPLRLFFDATPPKDTDWLLGELGLRPGKRPPAVLLALLAAMPREEMQEMIREIIREEMRRKPEGEE